MAITLYGFSIGYGGVAYGQAMVYGPSVDPEPIPPAPEEIRVPGRSRGDSQPHYPRFRTREEITEARRKLWAIPEEADEVVAKVAEKVIAKAQEEVKQQDAQTEPFDPIAWLEANQAKQRSILRNELRRERFAFNGDYMLLLSIQIQRLFREREIALLQEQEDEAIVALLFEM